MSRSALTVWLLGLTQIIGFGAVYYSFAILANDISGDFGWTQSHFFLWISLGLVAGGVTTPFTGKAFDRFGAARLMVVGSITMAGSLAAMALAPNGVLFGLGLLLANIFSTLALYDAAFTSLVQLEPLKGSKRIAYLTLIAGFASSLFWPLTTALDAELGWRNVLLIYAGLNLFLCAPIHMLVWRWSRAAREGLAQEAATPPEKAPSIAPQHYRTATILMTSGFMASSIALSAVLVQMVPMLQSLGFGAPSLWVATLFGPAQVVVRFTNLVFGSTRNPLPVTLLATALLPIGLFIAAASAPWLAGAIAAVIFIGMSSGLKSIVQGTLPLALFGSKGYGARLGFMAAFRYVASAMAPFIFAWVAGLSSPAVACIVFGLVGAAGLGSFVWLSLLLPAMQSDQANQRGTAPR